MAKAKLLPIWEANHRITELEAQLASAEQFAKDIAHKLNISYEPPVAKGECRYLAALETMKEQLAEANARADIWERNYAASGDKDLKSIITQKDKIWADYNTAIEEIERLKDVEARLCGQIDDAVGELAKANGLYSQCLSGNQALRQKVEQSEAQAADLAKELERIANAKRRDFQTDKEFASWAQMRAQAALNPDMRQEGGAE